MPRFASASGPVANVAFFPRNSQDELEFQFANLAPGSYTAWAFTGNDVEFRNPDFLRNLSGGVPIQVEDNKEQEITLDGVSR